MGLNGGNMTSIHPYDAQNRKRELAERVPAAEERKPTLAERLEAGKVRAASQDAGRQPLDAPRTTKAATEH
jgi:hypothetical protein